MTDLILYKDKNFKTPYSIEDLGDVQAGDSKIVEGYLYNSTPNDIVKIEYEVADNDIQILSVPTELESQNWQKVQIRYAPDATRTTALNTFVTFRGLKRVPPE